jgi:uncharacterized DUF497 family protein
MDADDFEWDDAKAAANLAKHGVSFEQARDAFDDPFAIVESRLLVVAHTLRADKVRISSAREAEPHERRQYHEENR